MGIELIKLFGLISYFLAKIVLIILIGVLLNCAIIKKCFRKKGLKFFSMFFFLVALFAIILISGMKDYNLVYIPSFFTFIFVIFVLVLFIANSVINWEYINKKLLFSFIFVLFVVGINEFVKLGGSYQNFTVLGSLGLIVNFLILYFFVIDWRIKLG